MSRYALSPQQLEAWKSGLSPYFRGVTSNLDLARMMRAGSDDKSLAGYLGEFRKGRARGLKRILGNPADLTVMCAKLGIDVDEVEALFESVRGSGEPMADVMWLPGFEDWGPVPLSEGFVWPVVRRNRKQEERDGQMGGVTSTQLFETGGRGMAVSSIVALPGTGLTTLLRVWSVHLRTLGWNVVWWRPGARPRPGSVLVIDAVGTEALEDAERWRQSMQGILLEGVVVGRGDARRCSQTWWDGQTLDTANTSLRPVDPEWLGRYRDLLVRLAPRRLRPKLKRLPMARLRELLNGRPFLGPRAAGCLLRAVVDDLSTDLVHSGPRLVADRARRRCSKTREGQVHGAGLQGVEPWLTELGLHVLAEPEAPILGWFETQAKTEALEVIDQVQATKLQREILRRALPSVSGQPVFEALLFSRVIRDDDTPELTHVHLLAPALARAVLDHPDRDALLHGLLLAPRELLVHAVAMLPGGPQALVEVLHGMTSVAFAEATQWITRWGRLLEWPQNLVDRWVATRLTIGGIARLECLGPILSAKAWRGAIGAHRSADLPGVRAWIDHVQSETRAIWDVSDHQIAFWCAWLVPEGSALRSHATWNAVLSRGKGAPKEWLEDLLRDDPQMLVDPSEHQAAWITAMWHPESYCQAVETCLERDALDAARRLGRALRWALASVDLPPVRPTLSDTMAKNDWPPAAVWTCLARCLEAPLARRHRKVLRTELAAAASGWATLPALPRLARTSGDLAAVLRFAITVGEATAGLTDPDGRLGPQAYLAARAGASPRAILALKDEPEWVRPFLLERGPAEVVDDLLGARGLHSLGTKERRLLAGNPDARPRVWDAVRDHPSLLRDLYTTCSKQGMDRQRLSTVCAAGVEDDQLELVAAWCVTLGVAPEVVRTLLRGATCASGERWLADVLGSLVEVDRDATTAWLVEELERRPDVFGHLSLGDVWHASNLPVQALQERVARAVTEGTRADALVVALVLRGRAEVERWLLEPSTMNATLTALVSRPDTPDQLSEALSRIEDVPSTALLEALQKLDDHSWIDGLNNALSGWTRDKQLRMYLELARSARRGLGLQGLWYRAAAMTTVGPN